MRRGGIGCDPASVDNVRELTVEPGPPPVVAGVGVGSDHVAEPGRNEPSSTGPARAVATRRRLYSIRSYFSFIATFKWQAILVVSVFVVADVLLAVIPLFIGRFVAALAETPVDTGEVYRLVVELIACSVGHDLAWRTAEMLYLVLLNHRSYEYENILFHRVVNQNYPYFTNKFTGKISSNIAILGKEFRTFLDEMCYTYVEHLIKFPTIVAIMFVVNVYTGLAFTLSIIIMIAVGRATAGRAAQAEKKATDVGSSVDGYTIDVIANFVNVKSFGKEDAEYRRVRQKRREVIAAANRSFFWNVVFWGSLSLVVRYLVWPGTILLNVYLFLHHEMSLAEIATFMSTLVIFSDYVWGTIWNISELNLRLARMEEAYRYLFEDRKIITDFRQATAAIPQTYLLDYTRSLRIRDLVFSYPENEHVSVLAGVTLDIAKNEKVGIVGRSGSGKTTLVKLLLGYYPLPLGTLMVDGKPVPNRALAQSISYVPQDTSLFHRSIRENITYGAEADVSQEQVEAAAGRAHAHEFITCTAEGYDTLVGERGLKLSMGQRQRIAIARAFLDDKPILILDEATSALDSESEVYVQDALEDLWRDKTVIAVAHRLSTLLHMDRIVVMDAGRIVEQGSHHELVALGGQYNRLWQRQIGGMIATE
jgi:ATP-binding cassette subfamily B protein